LAPSTSNSSIRFGDEIELDPSAWELRRAGRPLKLERIPMQILLFLAQQPGQLVSRDDIVAKIWGKNAYLDTDNSINGAMRKIRQALGDDSAEPRYIQTVTGLGYRFVAPVFVPGPGALPSATQPLSLEGPSAERRLALRRSTDATSQLPTQPESAQAPQVPPTGNRPRWALLGAVLVLCALAGWTYHRFITPASPPAATHKSMLAVLPLTNLTGDPSQEYFSDGLTEELIARLGNVDPKHLSVIARTSVMQYKDAHESLDKIARALSAEYVLEGSVRRDAHSVRITTQLVRASDQTQVWARQYDRELTSVLALEGEIAAEIADEIHSTLGQRGAPAAAPAQAAQTLQEYDAHDLYLRGRYFWNKRSAAGFSQALSYFQQSVAKDPGYAPAYAGLADTYAMMSNWDYTPHVEGMAKAHTAAMRAIELDPSLAEAHNALAVIAEDYNYDWRNAEKEFQRAIQLNPNDATAHQWYGMCLAYQGRFTEALTESDRARALDPLSPIVNADRAVILHFDRQYSRAIDSFLSALEIDPRLGRSHVIVMSYVEVGRFAEALEHIRVWRAADPGPWTWAAEAYVYGRSGERAKAESAIEKMQREIQGASIDLQPLQAFAYAGLKDKDHVIAALEAGYSERSSMLNEIKVAPQYDFLRDDSRFIDLVRRVGL
jgi:TolB-like protein/DNA-binding winged helix-turn-helix (wHTH) protein/Flp pilus assembly protein TadD